MPTLLDSIYNINGNDLPKQASQPKPKTLLEGVFNSASPGSATDVQLGQYGVGQSKYDTNVNPENVSNLEEIRAQKQSALDKWSNGLVKAAGTFGTGFLENTAGVVAGIGSAIINSDVNKLYNNSFTQSLDEFNNYIAQNFPNYHTKAEEDYNLLQKLGTSNFWSDQALNGAAFLGSAVATGAGLNKLASLGKLARAGKVVNEAELAQNGWQALDKAAKGIRLADAADFAKNAALMSYGESSIEARGIYNDTKNALIDQYKVNNNGEDPTPQALQEIESRAKAAGNFGFATNLAITGTTNALLFPKLLTKGYSATKLGLNKIAQQGETFIAEKTPFAKSIGSELLKGSLEEGGQEISQLATQKTLTDYYSKGYENRGEKGDFINSLIYGLQQSFGTEEGLENFFLGALMGGPAGAIQARSDIKQKDANTQQLVDILNTQQFKTTVSNFDNFVRATNYEQDKEEALANGSKFDYLNSEFNQNKSIVKIFIDNDGTDFLIQQYEDMKHLPEEEFKKVAGYDIEKPLPKSQIEIVDNAVKFLKRLDNTNQSIQELFPYNQALYETPEKYKVLTDNLWHYSTSIDNMNDRIRSINNDILKIASDRNLNIVGDGITSPFQIPDNPLVNAQIQQYNQDLQLAKAYKDKLIESYNLLANPNTQGAVLNDIISTAQSKVNQENALNVENNGVSNDINNEQQSNTEVNNQTATQSTSPETFIQNATSEKELNSIIDQLDKSGQSSPELLDLINRKREELNNQDQSKIEQDTPVNPEFGLKRYRAQTVFGTTAGQDNDEKLPEQRYFRYLENSEIPEGAKLQIVTKNNNKELFDKFLDKGAEDYEKRTGIDTIYALLVDKDGKPLYSTQDGQPLENGGLSNLVYSTLRTEKSVKNTGAKNNEQVRQDLINLRESLLSQTNPNIYLPILSKSQGITIRKKGDNGVENRVRNRYLIYDPLQVEGISNETISKNSRTNEESLVLSEKELENIQESIDNPFISQEMRDELNNDLKNVKSKEDLGRLYKKICNL